MQFRFVVVPFARKLAHIACFLLRPNKRRHTGIMNISLQSECLMHTEKPMGVAVFHCITQLILTMCQIRDHSRLWDHRTTGQL